MNYSWVYSGIMDFTCKIFNLKTSVLFIIGILIKDIFAVEPNFDVPVVNITVHAGKTAILPCAIEYLGDYKVVWIDQSSKLLTLETKRIIDDERMGIDRPYTNDWNLIIHDVNYADRGRYTCEINTQPVKSKAVDLFVLVPPKILDSSSTDIEVEEGKKVTLTCNVSGVPVPTVQWYKRPFSDTLGKQKERLRTSISRTGRYKQDKSSSDKSCYYEVHHAGVGTNGEMLIIHNITRYCDGIYECMAFNDVEPAVNREMKVKVQFAPEVFIRNRRIKQSRGKETILECHVEAYPQAISVWTFQGEEMRSKKDFRRLEVYDDPGNIITLSLRLMNLTERDFGEYICIAENQLGHDEKSTFLYELRPATPRPTTIPPIRGRTTPFSVTHLPTRWQGKLDDTDNPFIYNNGNDYDGSPVADLSSMGNSGSPVHISSMCFFFIYIVAILLNSL